MLSRADKVLLTLRMMRGVNVSSFVLQNLSSDGLQAYNSLFSLRELPDEPLVNMIFNQDTLEDLIKLRATDPRIMRISDALVPQLYEKFNLVLIDNHELGTSLPYKRMVTFKDFAKWYQKSFYDTPFCSKYHKMENCVKTAIDNDNIKRLRNLANENETIFEEYDRRGPLIDVVDEIVQRKRYDLILPVLRYKNIVLFTKILFSRYRYDDRDYDNILVAIYSDISNDNIKLLTSNNFRLLNRLLHWMQEELDIISGKVLLERFNLIVRTLLETLTNKGYDVQNFVEEHLG